MGPVGFERFGERLGAVVLLQVYQKNEGIMENIDVALFVFYREYGMFLI